MIGPRITTVFRSRWRAVWWSASILLTAYCSIPAKVEKAPPAPPAQQHHINPWSKDLSKGG